MPWFLVVARFVHFVTAIALMGVCAFECLIAGPAFRQCGVATATAAPLLRRIRWLAWASLGLVLVSGAAWLTAVAADMSGKSFAAVLSQGVLGIVLTETRFGEDWLLRLALAALLALSLFVLSWRRLRIVRTVAWMALVFSAMILASLAWAGHGAATAGESGDLHLAGDIIHLLGVGLWLGALPPLAYFLAAGRRGGDVTWAVVRTATRRYSALAVVSVIILLAGGLINTWFLAGTVPALVGTVYGQLLLAKIALFIVMVMVGAFNLFRFSPRLAAAADALAATWHTVAQLRRNALIEASIGLGIVVIVSVLGILPPGLHTQPGWPFPFRFDMSVLTFGAKILLAVLAAAIVVGVVVAGAAVAAGRYRRAAILCAGMALCVAIAWLPLHRTIEPAYPTSFYAPAVAYGTTAVVHGATLYAQNCAQCHGASGRGNGPGGAGLPIRPADLVAPHLFMLTPGDLFWSVSHGRADGAMPGFAAVLTSDERWDLVNFIRARAAGVLSREIGSTVVTTLAPPVPDFAFEAKGAQNTLRRMLQQGPVLLVLVAPDTSALRLQQLAAARPFFAAAHLGLIAVALGASSQSSSKKAAEIPPGVVEVSDDAATMLALFRASNDGGETDLMLDRNGDIRARWTASGSIGLVPPAMLLAEAKRVARFPMAAMSHAGHGMR